MRRTNARPARQTAAPMTRGAAGFPAAPGAAGGDGPGRPEAIRRPVFRGGGTGLLAARAHRGGED
ncbi:hypothetical protein [Streptomyces sp. NPDC001816]|uniref:hypothetical protein n=1 Tax=Streptomyces sp. NPDC001816 TaxID=3364612 RepID=UPI0036786140